MKIGSWTLAVVLAATPASPCLAAAREAPAGGKTAIPATAAKRDEVEPPSRKEPPAARARERNHRPPAKHDRIDGKGKEAVYADKADAAKRREEDAMTKRRGTTDEIQCGEHCGRATAPENERVQGEADVNEGAGKPDERGRTGKDRRGESTGKSPNGEGGGEDSARSGDLEQDDGD